MYRTAILIPFVYFIAGATSLAGIASTFYFKDDLHLTISEVQLLASLSILPWSIKPLYGFFSDRVPVFGMRRKPYLIFAGLSGSAGYLAMALVVHGFYGALACTLVSALGFALADVIVDGIVAERSRTQKDAGKLQALCRASLMVGALVVAYLSGALVETIGPRNVFLITGTLPLFTIVFACCMSEVASIDVATLSFRETFQAIRRALTPGVLWSMLFLFLWRATPTSGGAFTYFLIDEYHFTPEFFGRLAAVSNVTAIVAIVAFRSFFLRVSLKSLFFWVVVSSVLLSLPGIALVYHWHEYLGVSPAFLAFTDTAIGGVLQEISFLPLLVLAARLCPKGMEATMFALLASIMNIGLAVSDAGGAWLVAIFGVHGADGASVAHYEQLGTVMWIAILSSFLPLPLLPLLPETRTAEDEPERVSLTSRREQGGVADLGKTNIA